MDRVFGLGARGELPASLVHFVQSPFAENAFPVDLIIF